MFIFYYYCKMHNMVLSLLQNTQHEICYLNLFFFFFLLPWAVLGILHPQYESPGHREIPTILIIFKYTVQWH